MKLIIMVLILLSLMVLILLSHCFSWSPLGNSWPPLPFFTLLRLLSNFLFVLTPLILHSLQKSYGVWLSLSSKVLLNAFSFYDGQTEVKYSKRWLVPPMSLHFLSTVGFVVCIFPLSEIQLTSQGWNFFFIHLRQPSYPKQIVLFLSSVKWIIWSESP